MSVSLVALCCRTADRTPGGVVGAQTLAPLIGKRLGVEPRTIGTPVEPRETGYEEDLRESRGCLLEAGGQIDDALSGGRVPVLAAADCSIAVTTLPAALRHRPDARVLWLDAHGDYNTPDTSGSGYLGGMCLAGACGEWDAGLGDTIEAEKLVLAGVRDLDARRARAARAQRGHRDRRERGRDAGGRQERARRLAGVHPPRPRRARSRGVPGGRSRRPGDCPPTSSTT